MKKNTYILLTILIIFSLVSLKALSPKSHTPSNLESMTPLTLDKTFSMENSENNPYILILGLLGLFYLILLTVGVVNLIIFAIRKSQNKPILVNIGPLGQKSALSEETSSKVFFFSMLLLLIMYLIALISQNFTPNSIKLTLIFNLILQIGIIAIVLNCMKVKCLGFSLSKKHFIGSFQIYTSILPITLISLLINFTLAKKIGIEYAPNPAIEIFFLLKSKSILALLTFQVVLLGPLAEEIFFRGFIYKFIRTKYSFIISAIITSIFFSLIHKVPYNIFPLFILSVALCYIYEKTQNIMAPFFLHLIHNFISFCFFLTMKGVI